MADIVEGQMQQMVPELDDLRRKKLFSDAEIRHIIRRRRDFEYSLLKPAASAKDYLSYIRYEIAMESLRVQRSKSMKLRKRTISDSSGMRRMHFIFNRALKRFKADVRLWYQHIDFCLRSGSTKMLSKVLLRCVKFHPREVDVWLLATDRSLKMGEIKAARTLMMRGLRFSPQSPKLWGEFFCLEAQAARNVQLLATAETEGQPWAPASMLLRRGIERLKGKYEACAAFMRRVVQACDAARSDLLEGLSADACLPSSFLKLLQEVRDSLRSMRPQLQNEPSAEAARDLWQLWWERERAVGAGWESIVHEVVASTTPPAAVQQLVTCLGEAMLDDPDNSNAGSPARGLLDIAEASTTSRDAETSLRVLEALDRCLEHETVSSSLSALIATAFSALLRRAAASHNSCLRIRLLASQRLDAELPLSAIDAAALVSRRESSRETESGLDASGAALLLLTSASESDPSTLSGIKEDEGTKALSAVLRAMSPDASARPLIEAFLSNALATGGLAEFRIAGERAWNVVSRMWELPERQTEVLLALLQAECSVLSLEDLKPRQHCRRFEELLSRLKDGDEEKINLWVLYVSFVQRVSEALQTNSKADLPSTVDLHWRALRSVENQALYADRIQRVLGDVGL